MKTCNTNYHIQKPTNGETLTCCFKWILSCGDFLVKLDKKDKGKTKAALPTMTSAKSIELTFNDFAGLKKKI